MAIIRVKRVQTMASPVLLPGELGIVNTDLHFGRWNATDGSTLSATKLANQNASNTFIGTNVFNYTADDTTASVIFRNAAGTTDFYRVYGGKLQTASTFAFGLTDLVNKSYVDGLVQGLNIKSAVRVATTAALSATYENGSSGVGATLSGTAVGILTIDTIDTLWEDRILVKNQATEAQNGIYEVTVAGTAGIAFILTRVLDMNESSEFANGFVFVETGSNLSDTGWVCTTNNPITVGTTAIVWTQFSGAGAYTADETTLTRSGTEFSIKAAGVGFTQLRNSVAAGVSVIGRSANSAGSFAEIAAATNGHVLRRSGNALGFGTLPNTSLDNSSVTIGSTSVALGATVTDFTGLASVTSTTFVGALSGNANTATNIAAGAAGSVPYQSGVATTTFLAIGTVGKIMRTTGAVPAWTTLTMPDTIPIRSLFAANTANTLSAVTATAATLQVLQHSTSNVIGWVSPTGTVSPVYSTSPTIVTPTITTSISTGSTTFTLLDTTATTIHAFGATTTLNLGYDGTAASTTNISTGVVADSTTKAINIGTGNATSSITTIQIGTAAGSFIQTISLGDIIRATNTANTAGYFDRGSTAPSNPTRLNYSGHFYATQFEGLIDGGTWAA